MHVSVSLSLSLSLKFSQHMIFADDTQIYLSCLPSELDRGINLIAHDVGVIARYASDNGLKLNLAVSNYIRQQGLR